MPATIGQSGCVFVIGMPARDRAKPPNTANISRPVLVRVSAHCFADERNCAPAISDLLDSDRARSRQPFCARRAAVLLREKAS